MSWPETPSGQLVVATDGREHRFPAGARVLIGRSVDCDVVFTDTRVSRRHLQVTYEEGWILLDLDSGGGTWHRDTKVTARPVGAGLSVRLGDPVDGPLVEFIPAYEPTGALDPDADSDGAVSLRTGLTIGRDRDNGLVLSDLLVSRRHARILRTWDGYRVEDLGSANLTFVNGDPVDSATLNDGDVLTCGRSRFVRIGDRLHPLPADIDGLVVDDLSHVSPGGGASIAGLSLHLEGPHLLAVVGPAGAGKSTLLRLLAGELRPTAGRVRYGSQAVHSNAEVRTRIGMIPEHPTVHPRLTARQALRYAADLRLPMDLSRTERDRRIEEVLDELDLGASATVRVNRLKGVQSRRLSVGIELLTHPSLLLLDEPGAGLDPRRTREMMLLTRSLAQAGRQIIVTMRDPVELDLCDAVLVLDQSGREAYYGPPDGIRLRFGTTSWAAIFDSLERVADARAGLRADDPDPDVRSGGTGPSPIDQIKDPAFRRRAWHHAAVVARRHVRLLFADTIRLATLVIPPLAVVALALVIPAQGGLAVSTPGDQGTAARLLVVLVMGAAFIGMYVSLRDLVGERLIYRHERDSGLLPEGYLIGKLMTFCVIAAVQSIVLLTLVRVARPGPVSALLLGRPTFELAVILVATATVCCCLGAAISAWATAPDHVVLPAAVAVLLQLLLCGGLVPLAGRPYLGVPALIVPARWGYAAAASTVGLRSPDGTAPADGLWTHDPLAWIAYFLPLGLLAAGCTWLALRWLRR